MTQVSDTETRLECLLNNNKNSDFCAPLTSFDWNEVDPNLLGKHSNPVPWPGCLLIGLLTAVHFLPTSGTSSIDTTCTIWGLETGQVLGRVNLVSGHVKTQLIAHDKEVCVGLQRVVVYKPKKSIQQCVCVCARRCMTSPSAAREEEETCLRLWVRTGRSECSTCGTWSTAPSSTKTLSTTPSSASAGISRTPTIWPPWPWMAWRCFSPPS